MSSLPGWDLTRICGVVTVRGMRRSQLAPAHDVRRQVSEEVLSLMGRYRVSQERLAADIGVSQSFLSRRLNGEVPWDVDVLTAIARRFSRSLDVLVPSSSWTTDPDVLGPSVYADAA
jgi:hypothetical protein